MSALQANDGQPVLIQYLVSLFGTPAQAKGAFNDQLSEYNVLSPSGPDGGKYKPGASKGRYIRYVGAVELHGLQFGIIFDSAYWSTLQETPLWLEVAVPRGCRLQSLEREQPPRVFYEGFSERPLVPLILPLQAEKHAVIEDLLRQVRAVLRIVPETMVVEAKSMEPSVAPV